MFYTIGWVFVNWGMAMDTWWSGESQSRQKGPGTYVPGPFLRLVKDRLWKLYALPVGPEEAGTWWAQLEAKKRSSRLAFG